MQEKNLNNEAELTAEEIEEELLGDLSLEDIQNELMGDADPSNPLTELKLKLAESNDHYLRLAAEYDNFRRRSLKEKETQKASITASAVSAFLPVFDNLERAAKQETADADYKKGVEMTLNIMTEALAKLGITPIECSEGTAFDPELHEAMMHINDENFGENVIVDVFAKGFKSGDTVIRHAMVKVAN